MGKGGGEGGGLGGGLGFRGTRWRWRTRWRWWTRWRRKEQSVDVHFGPFSDETALDGLVLPNTLYPSPPPPMSPSSTSPPRPPVTLPRRNDRRRHPR